MIQKPSFSTGSTAGIVLILVKMHFLPQILLRTRFLIFRFMAATQANLCK
jgi:hypothetical protein